MQGELASPRHKTAQIQGAKGLLTNLADYRAVPSGFLSVAQDVVYDEVGNVRPRDGYEPWWPALPQRLQLADMQPGEATWAQTGTGVMSDDTTTFYNGVQSKKLVVTAGNNATATKTYASAPFPMNALSSNTNGKTTGIWVAFKITGLANVSSIDFTMVTSVGTTTFTGVQSGFTNATWASINIGRHAFTATETITSVAVKVTATGGGTVTLNFGDWYLAVLSKGSGAAGYFLRPQFVYVDAADNVWVADGSNFRVQKFDSAGNFVMQFGSQGLGNGQFTAPWNVAVNAAGQIYVSDRGNDNVQKFSPSGKWLSSIGSLSQSGPADGQFDAPEGIALDAAGNLFVCDLNNDRVQKFDANGNYVSKFGTNGSGPGNFDGPQGIGIDGAGNIYVSDRNNNRLQKFTAGGVFVAQVGIPGAGPGQFNLPVGVGVQGGNVYVADAFNTRVQRFDTATLTFQDQFGTLGNASGQFQLPWGVAVDSGGNIYVSDNDNFTVSKFSSTEKWLYDLGRSPYAADSFCTGEFEFRPIASPDRYLLAGFGETVYFDKNEAKAPFKILSGLTRNAPLYFSSDQYKAFICNGIDPNYVWTGDFFRVAGFPAPTGAMTLTAVAGAGLSVGSYFYAHSFVYGEGSTLHGESSIFITPASVATSVGNLKVTVSNISVGAVGSGVVQRRVYRGVVNGPNSATLNLAQVITDNVTTTFDDTLPDVSLILQAEGPIDNGVPPIAKYVRFFSKSMVYMNGNQVWYGRPGVDLSSTPETVPSTNTFQVGPAGQITGSFEFNNTLYITQEHGITPCEWVGSDLVPRSLIHSDQAQVGCADQNSIAIVGNDLVYFRDNKGQLQKMDLNEKISLASKPIKNILNNFNNNLANSLSFYENFAGKGALLNGTVGANLAINVDGRLTYNYRPISGITMGAQVTALGGHQSAGTNDSGDLIAGPNGSTYYFSLTAQQPLAFSKIGVGVRGAPTTGAVSASLSFAIYKIKSLGSLLPGNTLLASGASSQVFTTAFTSMPMANLDNTVYMPAGETVVVAVTISAGGDASKVFVRSGGTQAGPWVASNVLFPSGSMAGSSFFLRFDWQSAEKTVVSTAVLSAGSSIQRWATASPSSPKLAGGNSITLQLETDSASPFSPAGNNNYHAAPTVAYYLLAIGDDFPNSEPLKNSNPDSYLYPLRDYRINDNNTTPGWTDVFPLPAPNPQQLYAKLTLTMDPSRFSTPPNEATSRVSTDVTVSFPSIAGATVNGSTQGSFPNPYNPLLYAADIFTSAVITAKNLISKLGAFTASFQQNQQKLTFQIRTGADSTAILSNAWTTILPNVAIPSAALNNAATDLCFQLRVIFQDDPSQQGTPGNQSTGAPSVIYSMSVSWLGTSNHSFIFPAMPPTLVFYKDKVIGSWANKDSAKLDHTLYMDWFEDPSGVQVERFATWTGFHFCAFANVNGKLIGGTMTGGQLYRLFDSAIGDADTVWPGYYRGVPGIIATVPQSFGSSYVKTMHNAYMGVELNSYDSGYVLGPLNIYPTVIDGNGNSAVPGFSFSLSANPAGNGLLNAQVPSALADITASQIYQTLLSHAVVSPNNAASAFKPYQNEYLIDLGGEQERAFVLACQIQSFRSPDGTKVFPSFTGFGVEFFLENYRGV